MEIENQYIGIIATPPVGHLGKNLVGAYLILVISFLMIGLILTPEIMRLLQRAILSKNIFAWIMLVGGFLLVGLTIGYPMFMVIQAHAQYRNSRDLDRIGILTRGSIAEKWIDASEDEPVYHVRYKYLLDIQALQIVSEEIFCQLKCDQSIDVLHLKHTPHVSRMKLSV